jgi:hypothetical protein
VKKIITFAVIACMITSCVALKPDEIIKANIQISSTGTDDSKDSQPKERQNKDQGQQENKEGWTTGSIIKWIFIGDVTFCVVAAAGIIICSIATTRSVSKKGQKEQVIEKTYDIKLKLNEEYKSEEKALTIFSEIEKLEEIKSGKNTAMIEFNVEDNSTHILRECMLDIIYNGLRRSISFSVICGRLIDSCLIIVYRSGDSTARLRSNLTVPLGRAKASEFVGELKVRCNNKFIEDLIQVIVSE